jgi:hypothetical protein
MDVTYAVATDLVTNKRNIVALLTTLMNFALDKTSILYAPDQGRFIEGNEKI